jgi:ankyrin repeat protein
MGAAVLCQDIRILEMLLKAGADISAADDMTQTALTYAAANTKNPAVVAFLLDAGADARTPRMT